MHNHYVLVGQFCSSVCCRDLRVIPFLDRAKKNAGNRVGIEFERRVAFEVIRDNHCACDRWDVQNFSRGFAQVIITHRSVGGAEIDRLRHYLLLPASRTDRLIVEPYGRIHLRVFVEPLRVNRIRERRARAVDQHLRRSACVHPQRNCQPKNQCLMEFGHATKLPHPDSAGQSLYCYVCVTMEMTKHE